MTRSLIISLFIIISLVACRNENKPAVEEKPVVSKHSARFNLGADSMMQAYYNLTEAFVNWDSTAVISKSQELKNTVQHLSLEELKKDTVAASAAPGIRDNLYPDLDSLSGKADITAKRHAFNSLTQNLYDLLRAVQYDQKKLYLQQCPMAFNDTDPGIWLSPFDSIRNPYLGLHHPRYGKAMIDCGETKSTIDFVQPSK